MKKKVFGEEKGMALLSLKRRVLGSVLSGALNVVLKICQVVFQLVFVIGVVLMRMQKKTQSPMTQLTQVVNSPKLENVERKLEVERMQFPMSVKAVLVKDVSFQTEKGVTYLDEGTEVRIDPEENIAYHNGFHFDISQEEYKIAYLN